MADEKNRPILEDFLCEDFSGFEDELDRIFDEFPTARLQMGLWGASETMLAYAEKDIFAARYHIRRWHGEGRINSKQLQALLAYLKRINDWVHEQVQMEHPEWKGQNKLYGMRVFMQCIEKAKKERFPNIDEPLPAHTAEGLLHLLADNREIGWVYEWLSQLIKLEMGEGCNEKFT